MPFVGAHGDCYKSFEVGCTELVLPGAKGLARETESCCGIFTGQLDAEGVGWVPMGSPPVSCAWSRAWRLVKVVGATWLPKSVSLRRGQECAALVLISRSRSELTSMDPGHNAVDLDSSWRGQQDQVGSLPPRLKAVYLVSADVDPITYRIRVGSNSTRSVGL